MMDKYLKKYEGRADWDNPLVISKNKLDAHATLIPFASKDAALPLPTYGELSYNYNTPYYQTLNGTWKFHWVKKPAERPQNF